MSSNTRVDNAQAALEVAIPESGRDGLHLFRGRRLNEKTPEILPADGGTTSKISGGLTGLQEKSSSIITRTLMR